MRRSASLAAVLVLTLGLSALADSPGDELAAMKQRYDESSETYKERYAKFRPEFEAFAAKHAGTEEALGAKIWLLRQTWWLREDGTMHDASKALLDEILADHAESPQLDEVVQAGWVFPAGERPEIFQRLHDASPHDNVKAAALLAIGIAGLRSKDEAAQSEGRKSLEMVRDQYADLPRRTSTYGDIAEAHLSPHSPDDLVVGKPAPEIEGKDLDGTAMKLSDYRGKVVLLDFWGDW